MKQVLKRCLSLLLAIIIVFSTAIVGAGQVDFDSLFTIEAKAASSDLIWPCESAYYVTCMYYYKDGTKHSTRYGYTKAIDISGGGNIRAVASGTVETATNLGDTSFGKYVVIRHDNGYRSLYGHLSSYSVSVGQKVSQGQKIGVMGSTGNSKGTHLHFEYEGADPWKTYYNSKYASNIIFEQNVRSNNNSYNNDKTIVNVIDSNYKKNGVYYYYSGHTHTLGSEGYEAAHPHRVYRRCTGAGCIYYEYTGANRSVNSCSSCWNANITFSTAALSIKVGETKTVSFSLNGCLPEGYKLVYSRNTNMVESSVNSRTISLKGIAPGSFNLTVYVYSDSSKTHLIKSASIPVTVTPSAYTGKVTFDKSTIDLVIPTMKTGTTKAVLTGTWPDGAVFYLDYNENIISVSRNGAEFTITAKEEGSTDFTLRIVNKNNNNAYITSATCRVNVTNAEYKLTFDSNDGTGTRNFKNVPYGQKVYLDYNLTRSGYEFLGWSKNKNSSTAEYTLGSYVVVTADTTLYAVWKPITLTQVKCIAPDKSLYYIGDSLNTEGLGLLLRYSDGSEKVIRSGYTVSGFNSSTQGSKEITVSYGGKSDSFDVVVRIPEISLSKTALTIHNGQSGTITASTTPSGKAVTWTSSDTSVATVSNGTVTAKKAGTATITAKFIYNGITYSRTCVVNVQAHTAGSWIIDRNATCTANGSKHKECTDCGETLETAVITATGHTTVKDAAAAATCTQAGKTEGSHCSVCNTVIVAQQTIPAKGHTTVKDAAVAATCTQAGKTEGSHCSVCNTVIVAQQTIPAKGHTTVKDAAVAATCTTAGKTEGSHCSVCNTVIVAQQTIPAKGHTTVKDAAVAATCTTAGKTEGSHCSVCNAIIKAQTTIPAKGHTESDWIIDEPSTVTDAGTKHTECNACGKTIRVESISQLKCATPKVTAVNTLSGMDIKWNSVQGAVKYVVYRRIGTSSTWTIIATTTDTSCSDNSTFTAGVYYVYSVKAYNSADIPSDYVRENTATVQRVVAPYTKAANATNGINVTWGKVAGANKYVVLRRIGTESTWRIIGETTGTSFRDTNVKQGIYYIYSIRAVNGTGYSAYDINKRFTIQYITAPSARAYNKSSGVQVSWNSVTGAKKYNVYRRLGGTSTWVYVGTTTGTTLLDRNVVDGKYYAYSVRAINGTGYSAYNASKCVTIKHI